MTSLSELQAWVALRQADLSTLTASQLRDACGALFPVLLERLAHQEPRGAVLWRIITDPEAAPAFAARLHAHADEYGDLLAALLSSPTDLTGEQHAHLQQWLLQAISTESFERYVLNSLLAESRVRTVVIDSPDLAAILARRLQDRPELADFTFRTTTREWTALTDLQVQEHLRGLAPLPESVRRMLARDPRRLARAIDHLPTDPPDEGLVRTLRNWPEDDLGTLIPAILASTRLDMSWALRVLDAKPPRVIAEVLDTWWPRIATQLGIPAGVLEHLEVKRVRWWERWA